MRSVVSWLLMLVLAVGGVFWLVFAPSLFVPHGGLAKGTANAVCVTDRGHVRQPAVKCAPRAPGRDGVTWWYVAGATAPIGSRVSGGSSDEPSGGGTLSDDEIAPSSSSSSSGSGSGGGSEDDSSGGGASSGSGGADDSSGGSSSAGAVAADE